MPPFSRTPVELLRSRTEARLSGSDWFARNFLRNNLPLPQRADNITRARNECDGHCEAYSEAILVDPDWIMRSPSPVELYAPACVAYGSIYSTIEPTYDLQQYEDTDIVMASPSHHTRSPSPEQTQDSTSLESCWGEEPRRSTTPAPDSKPWGYSPWAETDASKFKSTEDSWGGDATKDDPSEESSRGTKPRSSTTGALEDAWGVQLFYQLYIRSLIYIAKHGEIESMMYLTFPSTSASCRIPVARSVTGGIRFRWGSIRVRMDVLTSIWSNARMFRDETWSLETAVVDQLLCQRRNRWC